MAYHPDKSAVFVGLERIKGTIGGRHGSLVLQHVGTVEDGAAEATLTVVSGTDELKGATGGGELVADPGGRIRLSVDLRPRCPSSAGRRCTGGLLRCGRLGAGEEL